jgi:tetratricopeptide (TPR) repeat protein
MTVSRDPGSGVFDLLPPRREQLPEAETARASLAAARRGAVAAAIDLFEGVARGHGESDRPLPNEIETEIAALAGDVDVAPVVRAAAWAAWARSRRGHGATREALRALDTATTLAPSPELLVDWIDTAREVHDPARITDRLEAGRKNWPDATGLHVLAAECALHDADLVQARAALEETVAGTAMEGRRLRAYGRLELMAGRPEDAITAARALLPIRPSEARGLLVVALHRLDRLAADPGLVSAVTTAPPDDQWILDRLAEALDAEGFSTEARKVLDHVLLRYPDDLDALRTRGIVLARSQLYDLAAADLDRAAGLGARDHWLDAARGEVARLRGDAATAVTLLSGLDADHMPSWARSALGQALHARGDLDGARDAFEVALQTDPSDLPALWGRAEVALALGGEEELSMAESLLTRALGMDAGRATSQALLGETYRRTGRPTEALAALERALADRPLHPYALAKKGQALLDLGDRRAAVSALEEASELEPTSGWMLDALEIALADADPARADASLRRVQRALRDAGMDVLPVQVRRARAARRRQRWADADRLYAAVCEAVPLDRELASEHAEVLRVLGRRGEALELVSAFPVARAGERDLTWQRIELLWQMDRLDEVRFELERLNEQADVPLVAVAGLGALRRQEGRREEARLILEGALRREPGHSYVLASLGALNWDEDAVDEAREALYAALGNDAGYGFALRTLASLEIDHGRDDEVRALVARVDVNLADPELVTFRAQCSADLGEYRAAIRTLEEYLEDVGDDATVLRAEGRAQLALGRLRRAGTCFVAAAGLDDRPSGLIEVVSALTRLDRWDEALRLAEAGRGEGLTDAGSDIALSVVARRCGAVTAAASLAESALARQSASVVACSAAARSWRLAGAPQTALQRARRVMRLAPVELSTAAELAECLWTAGHIDAARRAYGDLLVRLDRRVHQSPDHVTLRGWCLMRLGRLREASGVFVRSLASTNRTAMTFLDLALVSVLDGDVREARALAGRARDEVELLSPPVRRGVLTRAIHDLIDAEEHVDTAGQEFLVELRKRFADDRDGLTAHLERKYRHLPFEL